MTRLVLAMILMMTLVCGCTSSYTYICGNGDTATATMPKTVTTDPAIQGNVPVNGGTVSNPTQSVK